MYSVTHKHCAMLASPAMAHQNRRLECHPRGVHCADLTTSLASSGKFTVIVNQGEASNSDVSQVQVPSVFGWCVLMSLDPSLGLCMATLHAGTCLPRVVLLTSA